MLKRNVSVLSVPMGLEIRGLTPSWGPSGTKSRMCWLFFVRQILFLRSPCVDFLGAAPRKHPEQCNRPSHTTLSLSAAGRPWWCGTVRLRRDLAYCLVIIPARQQVAWCSWTCRVLLTILLDAGRVEAPRRREHPLGSFCGSFCGAKACGSQTRKMPREKPRKKKIQLGLPSPPSSLQRFWPGHIMIKMLLKTF